MAGQTRLMFAGGMHSQQGSVYQGELPGTVLCLVCGVVVTLVMAAMSLDLLLRRQQRSQRHLKDFSPHKRRKRRHRIRQL
jgi:Na+/glutamate symporter